MTRMVPQSSNHSSVVAKIAAVASFELVSFCTRSCTITAYSCLNSSVSTSRMPHPLCQAGYRYPAWDAISETMMH